MKAWFEDFNCQTRCFVQPIDRAILGGRFSLNVSFAFASDYQSAIEALLAEMDLRTSVAHIGLSACRSQFQELIMKTNSLFERHNSPAYDLWNRDKVFLEMAKKTYQKRTQRAWEDVNSL
tara:strand:+ start:56614 stop:56973 length:360 start_codon:yes stop_codon:yes gene_type:complete